MAASRLGTTGVRFHEDERRSFYGDIFDTSEGDVNLVCLKHGKPIAWHRHQRQDDRLFLVSGKLLVKTHLDMEQGTTTLMDHAWRGPLILRCGHWHGYQALEPLTIVLQFNGPGKWDGTDEERHPIDAEMPWIS